MAEKASHSRAKSAMGGKKSGSKPHSIHVRRGKSGGFIAHHHHMPDDDGMTPPPEEHVIPDMDSLNAHMAQNMGDQPPAPPPTPPAAAPVAGAQPGM